MFWCAPAGRLRQRHLHRLTAAAALVLCAAAPSRALAGVDDARKGMKRKASGAELATLPLPERCAVARLLAVQLVESMAWQRDLGRFAPGGRARLVVFLDAGSHRKLIGDNERCAAASVRLPRFAGQPARRTIVVTICGAERRGRVPYLPLWRSGPRSAHGPRLTFLWRRNRGYYGSDPPTAGKPRVRQGPTVGSFPAPTVEIELERRGAGRWRVLRSELKMKVLHSVP